MDFDLGPLHPIVVHFALALLFAGVLFRLAHLAGVFLLKGRLAFAGPAACTLLLAGLAAAYVAVETGESASADAEAIPGAEAAVEEHEEWGEWTFRLFAVIAVIEVVALVLERFGKATPALLASGVLGLVGLFFLYETGEHGGTVVFSYAGGVGTRSRDPQDVSRLLLAGLYQQAVLDRAEGRGDDAARMIEVAASRFPGNLEVQLLLAESQLEDRQDAAAATATLGRLQIPRQESGLRLRHGVLLVDALVAAGHEDAARAALSSVKSEFPEDGQVKERVRRLEGSPQSGGASPATPASPSGASAPTAAPPSSTASPTPQASPSPSASSRPSPSPSPSPTPSPTPSG
jgi:uncharacterized membrane protein